MIYVRGIIIKIIALLCSMAHARSTVFKMPTHKRDGITNLVRACVRVRAQLNSDDAYVSVPSFAVEILIRLA